MKRLFLLLLLKVTINILSAQSPGGISGYLDLWLKPETLALGDSADVSLWPDSSPLGYNAFNDSSTGPCYRNAPSKLINYNPTVEFDGTSDGLNLGANDIITWAAKGGLTIFAIVKPDQTSNKTHQFIFDYGGFADNGYGYGYGYENAFIYCSEDFGGARKFEAHTNKDKAVIATMVTRLSIGQAVMVDGKVLFDDESITTTDLGHFQIASANEHRDTTGPVSIGRLSKYFHINYYNGRYFDGRISEVIAFSRLLNLAEIQRVDSYLAIKYGIGLSKNYINSIGETIWDMAANNGYNYDIAGIMRDDGSALDQRQSKAANDNEILSIGKGTIASSNPNNPNSFGTNLDCFIWGSNGGATFAIETTEKPGVYARLGREWKVAEPKNNVGTVRIQFDLADNGTISSVSHLKLLVDSDGDFTNATIATGTFTQSGSYYYIDYDLSNGQYFTLATTDASTPLKPETISKPGVSINTTSIDPSAELHIAASSGTAGDRYKGVLLPRMDESAMNSIASPPTGLLIYHTGHKRFMYNAGLPNMPKWMVVGGVLVQTDFQMSTQAGYYKGEMRYNDTTDTIWYWDGSSWVEIDNN